MAEPRDLYDSYEQWRGRRGRVMSAADRAHQDALFRTEMARAGARPGCRIFEAGIGEGVFLRWAVAQGYRASGCDIVAGFVDAAVADGLDAVHGDAAEALAAGDADYDLVVCFDVLEHLDGAQIDTLLARCAQRLVPGGRALARFPNGMSPFSRAMQHGDATHRTVLTPSSLRQRARPAGLDLRFAGNAARSWRPSTLAGLLKPLVFALRYLVEVAVGVVYLGGRAPLDPNVTVVLERRD